MRIARKMLLWLLPLSLVPLAVTSGLSYYLARTTSTELVGTSLQALALARKHEVEILLARDRERLELLASRTQLRKNLADFVQQPTEARRDQLCNMLRDSRDACPALGQILFALPSGQVVAATSPELVGIELAGSEWWGRALREAVVDAVHYDPGTRRLELSLAIPVQRDEHLLGVLVLRNDARDLRALTSGGTGLGQTGEVLMVRRLKNGQPAFLLPPRLAPLHRLSAADAHLPIVQALDGQQHLYLDAVDYRGERVLIATAWLPGPGWAMETKIDAREALADVRRLGQALLAINLGMALAATLAAALLARRLTAPVLQLRRHAEHLRQGDLSQQPALPGHDELGDLNRALNGLAAELDRLNRQTHETAQVMVAAVTEITGSTHQLAASATETATAVTQTTATVEEVRQTVQVASEKAGTVSQRAQRAASVAQSGSTAASATKAAMLRIREQMEVIAESILHLNEQLQTIGDINSTVSELAEKSNLLAVNASIEAAKAGEHGKGFAVVAHEVRNLATRSKGATGKVRSILHDIQAATSAAVMATEKGAKVVQEGVVTASDAGEAIANLAAEVTGSAQAATQIAASSREQFVGIDQVVSAMENIREASQRNAQAMKQVEEAAQRLHALSTRLRSLEVSTPPAR